MDEINDFGENNDLKQSITDLAVEYGLVTEYTSMIVLRDEVFREKGIQRSNQARIKTEQQARQTRAAQPIAQHRVDQKQPMFKSSRPNFSGGGAIDGMQILLITLLLLSLIKYKFKQQQV